MSLRLLKEKKQKRISKDTQPRTEPTLGIYIYAPGYGRISNMVMAYHTKHLRNMLTCPYFVEMVIHSEFLSLGETFKESYQFCLQDNIQIFSNGRGKGK